MIPIIIVPDVNVIISSTSVYNSPSLQIMKAWKNKQLEVATSKSILVDLQRAFNYPKVRKFVPLNDKEILEFIKNLSNSGTLVPGKVSLKVSPDPDDNKIFECAVEAKANYIVSGDKKHVLPVGSYESTKVLSPRDFVEEMILNSLTI